jgi:outer membrane receptor protein involved in Fe transport
VVVLGSVAGSVARADGVRDEAELHFRIGIQHFETGDYQGALEHFLASNRLSPNPNVRFDIARSYERLGAYPEAFRYFVEALRDETAEEARRGIRESIQRLTPHVAIISVETRPPGATLFLDRTNLGSWGTSPAMLGVREGRYLVIAELAGHVPESTVVDAHPGRTIPVTLELRAIVGRVRVEGEAGATVHLEDAAASPHCTTPCELELPPGPHVLYLRKEGFQVAQKNVTVSAQQSIAVHATLSVLSGSLLVSTSVAGALITIDGRASGFTPVVIPAVSVGSHRVAITLRDYASVEREIEIQADRQTNLDDVFLTPEAGSVTVASKTKQAARDTPGVVTVFTKQEIHATGARDLTELLLFVPGFHPAVDVQGVVGLGFRGNWGHEGKVLLLIDGQEYNELLFSTPSMANSYPLEHVERIEVVRGPGSAIYGGFAELAVVHVHTRSEPDVVALSGTYGQMDETLGHRRVSAYYRERLAVPDGALIGASIFAGQGNLSDAAYTDFAGGRYSLRDASAFGRLQVNAAAEYKRLRLRLLYDDLHTTTQDGFDKAFPEPQALNFRMYLVNAQYEMRIGDHLTVSPRLSIARQVPWQMPSADPNVIFDKTVDRYLLNLTLSYRFRRDTQLLLGAEALADRASLNGALIGDLQRPFGTSSTVSYTTLGTFGQVQTDHRLASLTLGARFEHHSASGSSFVPRIGVTRRMGRFHGKLLASRAFRAPGIENINLSSGQISPERTTVYEAEFGYHPSERFWLSANVFDTTIDSPIVYEFDSVQNQEVYTNASSMGTRGLELESQLYSRRANVRASYSFYTADGKDQARAFSVPGHDDYLLAFPKHKLALMGTLALSKKLDVSTTAVLLGSRYGYTHGDVTGQPQLGREDPVIYWSVAASYRDLEFRGLTVSLGMNNLLDEPVRLVQPYRGKHAPLPGPSREALLRVAYTTSL